MAELIKMSDIIADLKARDFLPHRPVCDNDGKINVFSKYNFSFPEKLRMFYVLDNDNQPVVLFIANDGNIDNRGLFIARDISLTPNGSDFAFSNTPAAIGTGFGTLLGIDNVSTNSMVLRYTSGFYNVETNGDYSSTNYWVISKINAPVSTNVLSICKTKSGKTVTWGSDNTLTLSTPEGQPSYVVLAYKTSWVDFTGWGTAAEVTSDNAAYGVGHIIPLGNDVFGLYQTRLVYKAGSLIVYTVFSKFKVSANDAALEFIVDGQTAGWKAGGNAAYSNEGGSYTYGWFYSPETTQFYMADVSQWVGYRAPQIRIGNSMSILNPLMKSMPVADTSVISKSASPGGYYEIGDAPGGGVYAIRSGCDSSGAHYALSKYTLVNGIPTVVNGGLPDGSTVKEVLKDFANKYPPFDHSNKLSCVKKVDTNYLFLWDPALNSISSVTFNASTSDVNVTTVRTWQPFTKPIAGAVCNVAYDMVSDRLYVLLVSPDRAIGYKLYYYSTTGAITLVGSFGANVVPDPSALLEPNVGILLDLDLADPAFFLCGAYTIVGGHAPIPVSMKLSNGATAPILSPYVYRQHYAWSKLLGKYVTCYSHADQSGLITTWSLAGDNTSTTLQTITFKMPAPVGLGGFISNGMLHLGGYTTNIYDALARNGLTPKFSLPPNANSYLYLVRIDDDKLDMRISAVEEANTFFKVQIAAFQTNSVGVITTIEKPVGTF